MFRKRLVIPAPAFFIASGVSQYIGASLAVGLFAVMSPLVVTWFRVATAAIIFLVWRRPRGLSWKDVLVSAAFGLIVTGMNLLFYESIARIPLGAAVSLEFLGPVLVAALGSRGWLGRLAVLMVLVGVVSIGGFGVDIYQFDQLLGVALALIAGIAWAFYIVIGKRIAVQRSGLDSLAIGMTAGALALAPLGIWGGGAAWGDWKILLTAVGVGILSTAVSYGVEQYAFARVSAAVFALLTALLPVTSLLIGVLMLRQIPTVGEMLGLALVSAAVWISSLQNK